MKNKRSKLWIMMSIAVILLIALIALALRFFTKPDIIPHSSAAVSSSGEHSPADGSGPAAFTEAVTAANAETLDLTLSTVIVSEKEFFSPRHEILIRESSSETTETKKHTEPFAPDHNPSDSSSESETEFSENSDNLPFIGTWVLHYDLTSAQESALKERYSLSEMPSVTVSVRLRAVLSDDGSFTLQYSQEDHKTFQETLAAWYAQASALYGKTTSNPLQKASFTAWITYRKGLYSLLSPDVVSGLNGFWHINDDLICITDEYGNELIEMQYSFRDETHLTVTSFRLSDPGLQSTVDTMKDTLGINPPFDLLKE